MSSSAGANTRHVRTRTGCWTCRFRKKKCDEARPACEQCSHLRLTCDGYDGQPVWMKDPEKASEKKLEIKRQMVRRSRRRKKNQDANKSQVPSQKPRTPTKPPTPPPTTNIDVANESAFARPKQFPAISLPVNLGDHDFSTFSASSPEDATLEFSPFNMRNMHWAVNGFPPLQQHVHTLSPPATDTLLSGESTRAPSAESTIKEEDNEDVDMDVDMDFGDSSSQNQITRYSSKTGPVSYFQFADLQIQTDSKLEMNLANLYLRSIFGVTYRALSDEQVVQYNDALILPMFQDNKSFLHGCLSSTALHLTATNISETHRKALVTEVYRHRQRSLKSLKKQVANSSRDGERIKILATVCALISFEVFSRRTDWQVHVKAATDCVTLLNWCVKQPTHPGEWFIYSRVLWLDILSSITTGANPVFANFYRNILFYLPESRNQVNRLVEMTGCEDSVLYLISEITCLENWKFENLPTQPWQVLQAELVRRAVLLDRELQRLAISDLSSRSPRSGPEYNYWNYNSVHTSPQGDEVDYSESDFGDDNEFDNDFESDFDDEDDLSYADEDPASDVNEVVDGIVRRNSSFTGLDSQSHHHGPTSPTDTDAGDMFVHESTNKLIEDRVTFRKAVTEAFRIMARVYLRIVVYGFNQYDAECQSLLEELLAVINFIPNLYMGYERSIISPLLIVGSLAIKAQHQNVISTRLKKIPHMAKYGNLGNVDKILTEIWSRQWTPDPFQPVPWRQVMKEKNWEYLMKLRTRYEILP
ncbi:hypothetical protein H072_3849 [Dactylellina haptotyla CBS 200.50]|uniref:Zn(2)-C6 fungal-type domain-containing protein n=1 Tax=Dactylellina haptotyla (strain CBS 200.50) TaxID=1284197 RepID=S8C3A5_DACHA|nr:hypothetical protein H072_3849 [Dactylellina haptotyla CBS 200.50]